jgi:hypothetical protein
VKELFVKLLKYIKHLFTDHPQDVGESYLAHMFWAIVFGIHLLVAGAVCLVHSVFPFLFTDTATSITEWVVNTSRDRGNYE